jgi:putative endonuclease
MNKQELGLWGEQMAALYLKGRGLKVVDQRYRIREGEIDLIMLHSGDLVFVEVKTRTGTGYGSPEEAVTKTKIGRMRKAAGRYIHEYADLKWQNIRFDVVAVQLNRLNDSCEIRHLIGIT